LAKHDPTAARRLLVAQVRDLATGVGLAIRTARALHLPVEPGVPAGRDALILWAHLLDSWGRWFIRERHKTYGGRPGIPSATSAAAWSTAMTAA
jgi:hypothetical protein